MTAGRDRLEYDVRVAQERLDEAKRALEKWDTLAENNRFDSIDEAVATIEENLRERAFEDCEGSYNCGQDFYTQEFIVDGVTYSGTLTCEYNRHDKTYYYLESSVFTFQDISSTSADVA